MEKFLANLELSNKAINIYLKSLNYPFLVYSDLKAIEPEIGDEDILEIIENLMELDLLIKIVPEKGEILTRYYSIPPITNILTYFQNIEQSFSTIQENIKKLIVQSTNKSFGEKSEISLDDVQEKAEQIFKDFQERTLLERKDAEDIEKRFEIIHKINEKYTDLQDRVINLTKAQFGNLIKMISRLKNQIQQQIQGFEFKKEKDKDAVINIIEQIFKTELDDLVETFIESITASVREEFEKTSFKPIINQVLQSKDEYKMLLQDLINNFESNFNELSKKIKKKQEGFKPHLEELKEKIIQRSNQIIQNSVKQVIDLNKPILEVISDCRELIYDRENLLIDDVWTLNTISQMKEELLYAINNSEDDLMVIIPNLKEYASVDLFKNLTDEIMIYIASSDHFVNSKVKQLMELDNVKFKKYDKTNFIGVRSDKDFIAYGFIDEKEEDKLNDFIGIGTNNKKVFESLSQTLNKVWSAAEKDKGKPSFEEKKEEKPSLKSVEPPKPQKKQQKDEVVSSVRDRVKELDSTGKKGREGQKVPDRPPEPKQREASESIEGPSKEYVSNISPSEDDKVGNMINEAFNEILKNLNELTGIQFAQKMEQVADLVLEQHGFSVSLHHIRRYINKFEKQGAPLSNDQKEEILENFEEWKKKLFKK